MRQVALLYAMIALVSGLQAQTVISGRVLNNRNQPVTSASIKIKESGLGVNADTLGNYQLVTGEKGKITIEVSSIGYATKGITLMADAPAKVLDIRLKDEMKQLTDVVVVGAGTFEASDKAKGASLTPMDAVTVAGSGGDIANSLRALPGVQRVGEAEGLFVRGGTSEEAKQFIDGTLFPNPNYSSVPGIMQPARINPFLFKGILFNTGGYSALYGDALSSALILETIDLPTETSAGIHVFPTSQGFGFQRLSKDNRSSFGVNAQYGNQAVYNRIVPQRPGYFRGPVYSSGGVNFRIKTSKTGMLKFYANYGFNQVGMKNPDLDSADLFSAFEVKGSNLYTNLSYKESLGNHWRMDAGLGYNKNKEQIHNGLLDANDEKVSSSYGPFAGKNSAMRSSADLVNGKVVMTKHLPRGQALRLGAEYLYNGIDYDRAGDSGRVQRYLPENALSVFAEGDIRLTKNIAAKVGLRFEHSSLLQQSNLSPRVGLAYKFDDGGQVNLAYGRFYQKPGSRLLLQNEDLVFTQASHYIVNYQKKASNRLLRVEAFYKSYKDLVVSEPSVSNSGNGYAKGVELFFRDKKTIKDLDYWFTYSYLDTKRKYLDYPSLLQPSYTTPHTLSLAVKKFIPEWKFSANMSYALASGRPYYNIQTGTSDGTAIHDQGTTKAYHNMNLSFAYLFSMFPNGKYKDFSGIGFGANNVLGTRQVFGYNYSHDGSVKAPITLPATRSYYLGIFISLGIDRTDDFIDDML